LAHHKYLTWKESIFKVRTENLVLGLLHHGGSHAKSLVKIHSCTNFFEQSTFEYVNHSAAKAGIAQLGDVVCDNDEVVTRLRDQ
jgi:hypothetical protein